MATNVIVLHHKVRNHHLLAATKYIYEFSFKRIQRIIEIFQTQCGKAFQYLATRIVKDRSGDELDKLGINMEGLLFDQENYSRSIKKLWDRV